MRSIRFFLAFLFGAVISAVAVLYRLYSRERRVAITRLANGSQVVETDHGPVEYAEVGRGPAVLVLHGGGAGYDSGLILAFPEWGFRFVSPSRPGYLRTPLETGRTPEEQADAFAALLDVLGIKKAAVWGMSGSGPSAIQFALRHPERCWALILLSAASQPLPAFPLAMRIVVQCMPHNDFIPWLMMNPRSARWISGPKLTDHLGSDPQKNLMFDATMRSMFPISLRMQGGLNDVQMTASMSPLPLERVSVPTLVIHGDSDTVVPFAQGQYSAQNIPGAQLLAIQDGDHMCFITHLEKTGPVLKGFLETHVPRRSHVSWKKSSWNK